MADSADSRLSDLPAAEVVGVDDLLYLVADPSGSRDSVRATVAQLLALVEKLYVEVEAGEPFTVTHVGYIAADGKAYLAAANDPAKLPAVGFARSTVAQGELVALAFAGVLNASGFSPGWTPGLPVYVTAEPGGLTQTPPAPGVYRQVFGVALTSDRCIVSPELLPVLVV